LVFFCFPLDIEMVTSPSKRKVGIEAGEKVASDVVDAMDSPAPEKGTKASSSKKRRKQLEERLRQKNMGLGLSIEIKAPVEGQSQRKKTVFGSDDEYEDLADIEDNNHKGDRDGGTNDLQEDSSDSDDEVEEIGLNVTKQAMIVQEVAKQEEIRLGAFQKKRKRKTKKEATKASSEDESDTISDDDEEDLPDDLFALLDADRGKTVEKRKIKDTKNEGKHTTFVVPGQGSVPVSMEVAEVPNMEVVVLGKTKPSQTLNLSGTSQSTLSKKFARHALGAAHSESVIGEGSKRSRAMKFRRQRGKPCPSFIVRK
jgi:hypothetical protein